MKSSNSACNKTSATAISISMKWSWTLPCLSPWVDGKSRCSSLHTIKCCARVFSEKEVGLEAENRAWLLSLLPEEDRPPEANPGLLTNGPVQPAKTDHLQPEYRRAGRGGQEELWGFLRVTMLVQRTRPAGGKSENSRPPHLRLSFSLLASVWFQPSREKESQRWGRGGGSCSSLTSQPCTSPQP